MQRFSNGMLSGITRTLTVVCLCLLSACAVQSTRLDQHSLSAITHWQAKGKISLTLDGKRQNANFTWLNNENDFDIRLHGPFGAGAVHLSQVNGTVVLRDGKQQHQANSPEQLLFDTTGWNLPISELRWWMKAMPAPGSSHEPLNIDITRKETTQPAAFKQQGWQLRYSNYHLQSGHYLPGKITATRGNIKLIVVVKQWALFAP